MKKKLLNIAWHGKLGDCIISSGFLQCLAQSHDFNIITLANEKLYELYKVDYLSDVIVSNPSEIENIENQLENISIHTIVYLKGKLNDVESIFIKKINPKYIFTLDPYFNKESHDLYQYHLGKPFVYCYLYILNVIGELCEKKTTIYKIGKMKPVEITGKNIVLFNPFASREDKSISVKKSINVLNGMANNNPDLSITILCDIKNIDKAREMIENVRYENIKLSHLCSSISELFYVVSTSSVVVSVDTAIVHIAQALSKPMIAIYPKLAYFNVWSPLPGKNISIINAKQKKNYTGFGNKNMNNFETNELLDSFNDVRNGGAIFLTGKITNNFNVAHKNLAMQMPFFSQSYPELSHCHNGTINVVFDVEFKIINPSFSINDLFWTHSRATKESFDFLRVILHAGKLTIPAWLYSPSNSPHNTRLEFKEIIAEKLYLDGVDKITIEILDLKSIEFIQ